MTDYKAIHGKNIQSLASDLDNAEGEGQVWYNSTSGDFKIITKAAGAWATGGNLNQTRQKPGGAGTQTSGILWGGYSNPPQVWRGQTETYDGSSWTEVGDMNQVKSSCGSAQNGTQTASHTYGGNPGTLADSEEFNGTSWAEVTDMPEAKTNVVGGGTQVAGIACGGEPPAKTTVEYYDGTNWTEVGALNTARAGGFGGAGTQSDMLVYGGAPGTKAITESYNGTAWTEVSDLNTGRVGHTGFGRTGTTAMAAGQV